MLTWNYVVKLIMSCINNIYLGSESDWNSIILYNTSKSQGNKWQTSAIYSLIAVWVIFILASSHHINFMVKLPSNSCLSWPGCIWLCISQFVSCLSPSNQAFIGYLLATGKGWASDEQRSSTSKSVTLTECTLPCSLVPSSSSKSPCREESDDIGAINILVIQARDLTTM